MGVVLSVWLLCNGAGSFIALKIKSFIPTNTMIFGLQTAASLLPFLIVYFIKHIAHTDPFPGFEHGLQKLILLSLSTIFPFCIITGALFVLLAKRINDNYKNIALLSAESLGSFVAGLALSFTWVIALGEDLKLLIIMAIGLASAVLFLPKKLSFAYRIITLVLLLSIPVFLNFLMPFSSLTPAYVGSQQIELEKNMHSGKYFVTRSGQQVNYFHNGYPVYSSDNVSQAEELAHYAMLQTIENANVLVAGSPFPDLLKEIIKHKPEQINCVSPDKELNNFLMNDSLFPNHICNVYNEDARIYIGRKEYDYDVIISTANAPSNFALNRFFTEDFLLASKRALKEGGVLSVSLPSSANYISEEALNLHRMLYFGLKKYFHNVLLIPAGRDFFLASDAELQTGFSAIADSRQIQRFYAAIHYSEDDLLHRRAELLISRMEEQSASPNTDLFPRAVFGHVIFQGLISGYNVFTALLLLIPGLLFLVFSRRKEVFLMYFSGFSYSLLTLLLIFIFQIHFGSIYSLMGLFFALNLAALAIGALFFRKYKPKALLLTILLLGFCVFLIPLSSLLSNTGVAVFMVFSCIPSLLTGGLFSSLISGNKENALPYLYAGDLLGASAGALTSSVFFVPLCGLMLSSWIAGIGFLPVILMLLIRKT